MDFGLRSVAGRLSRVVLLVLVAGGVGGDARAQALGTLVTFGDSYTQDYWRSVPSWVTQLRRQRLVAVRTNYARAGATAAGTGGGRATFDGQLDDWERAGRPHGRRTVVYLGYNDVNRAFDLGRSARALAAGVDRLLRGGANRDGRRLLLTAVHDWSRNPGGVRADRARVASWNRHVRGIAAARRLRTVDVFARIEAVFRSPRRFGIADTEVPSRTDRTHLFFDGGHFGARGQRVVAETMREALAR